jgi:hypothetical protein
MAYQLLLGSTFLSKQTYHHSVVFLYQNKLTSVIGQTNSLQAGKEKDYYPAVKKRKEDFAGYGSPK